MPGKARIKKKLTSMTRKPGKPVAKRQSTGLRKVVASSTKTDDVKGTEINSHRARRREALYRMLMAKRAELMKEIEGVLGQSLTEEQQRRLESAMDVGDQALMDLERELGISLQEMRNRKRQLIDEALARLADGTYGICANCGVEIGEKRLAAVPFAKLCVECQSQQELLEKIEKEEERY